MYSQHIPKNPFWGNELSRGDSHPYGVIEHFLKRTNSFEYGNQRNDFAKENKHSLKISSGTITPITNQYVHNNHLKFQYTKTEGEPIIESIYLIYTKFVYTEKIIEDLKKLPNYTYTKFDDREVFLATTPLLHIIPRFSEEFQPVYNGSEKIPFNMSGNGFSTGVKLIVVKSEPKGRHLGINQIKIEVFDLTSNQAAIAITVVDVFDQICIFKFNLIKQLEEKYRPTGISVDLRIEDDKLYIKFTDQQFISEINYVNSILNWQKPVKLDLSYLGNNFRQITASEEPYGPTFKEFSECKKWMVDMRTTFLEELKSQDQQSLNTFLLCGVTSIHYVIGDNKVCSIDLAC